MNEETNSETGAAACRRRVGITRVPRLPFREPKLLTGFPDVGAVTPSEKDVLLSEARLAPRPIDLKVIHHLFRVRGAMRNGFRRELGQN